MKMQAFKPRPPKIEAIKFDGDYVDACDVIEQLHMLGIEASFVPEITVFDENQPEGGHRHIEDVKNHILIFGRGEKITRLCEGEWIVWDPALHNTHYIQPWNFNIMQDRTVKERYLNRTDEDDA